MEADLNCLPAFEALKCINWNYMQLQRQVLSICDSFLEVGHAFLSWEMVCANFLIKSQLIILVFQYISIYLIYPSRVTIDYIPICPGES